MVDLPTIKKLLDENTSARLKTWLDICSGCGLCAESCFYYQSYDCDPRLSPAFKVKNTVGEMFRRKGRIDEAFLEKCYETLWFKCTLCKRCSLFCPFGIDIASMMAVGRSICHSLGKSPELLLEFTENHRKSGNHMGLPALELTEACEWIIEDMDDTFTGITIPVDKPDAAYMYTINPREVVFYPQDIGDAAVIFAVAGENWTIPSSGWDCTNLPMFAGDRKVAAMSVENVYKKAAELNAGKVLVTECGHAYRSLLFEGPYMTGKADGMPPVEIIHYVQLINEYLNDGRILIDPEKKIKGPVTYQDPCNVSRNGGLWEESRNIVSYLADDFREMTPTREYNHCCGGGGGIMPMGPKYKPGRMEAGRLKAEQIRATGAKTVIAPCHNCIDQIKDLGERYELDIKVMSIKELLMEMMVVPEKFKPKQEKDQG